MKKLSVVILTWNSEKHITPCLDSLISAIDKYNYEVIIVDNGSTDNTLNLLKQYLSSQIHLITNNNNKGVAKARNQALRMVSGDLVLILDIDTEVNKQAIDALITTIESDDKIGIAAVKLVASDGEVQQSCRRLPTLRYKLQNVLASKGILKESKSQFYKKKMHANMPFEVEYVIGACQLVRKTALDKVGLLDENIFYGPEDADFCLRMKQKGWTVIFIPSESILHHYQQISNKNIFSFISRQHIKALLYYFWKHKRI